MVDTNSPATHLGNHTRTRPTNASTPTFGECLKSALRRLPTDRGERVEEYQVFPDWEAKNRRQESIEIPLMVKAMKLPTGGRILEVGCGRGVGLVGIGRLLAPKLLVGLDIERDFLTDARSALDENSIDAQLFWGDVRQMPFPDASFDLVIDFGTCFHIAHPHRALGEIARVLDIGGLFVHETMIAQLLSHPLRSLGRAMPAEWFPQLQLRRWRGLWTCRQKTDEMIGCATE